MDDVQDPEPLVSLRALEFLLGFNRETLKQTASQSGRYYNSFDRRRQKGTGKWRHIDNPVGILKQIQRRIATRLLTRRKLPPRMLGGVTGKSIADNAALHVGKPCLVSLDLRDCFPHVRPEDVRAVYCNELGCSPEIATLLVALTTFQGRLPQGAPTSTTLCNLALIPLYRDVEAICDPLGVSFSFWVDDIALSGTRAREAIQPVVNAIQRRHHAVRCPKTKVASRAMGQRLTGTTVNVKISAPREYRDDLRVSILRLAAVKDPLDADIRAIRGRIAHVAALCASQGASLTRLAHRVLPESGIGGPKPRSDEVQPCRCSSRHRYYKKAAVRSPLRRQPAPAAPSPPASNPPS